MSVPAASELDPLLTRQDHRQLSCCCKLSYKPRKFSSKGAVLVLVWQFLVYCGVSINIYNVNIPTSGSTSSVLLVGVIVLVLVAIISGWLADTKVGRSKVVQIGLFLTWLGVFLVTACNLFTHSVHTSSNTVNAIALVVQYVAFFTTYGGADVFFTNVVQFGLEQIPDASSDAMTAFITWFLIVTFVGEGSFRLAWIGSTRFNIPLIRSITSCVLLSIAMCSKFLFSHWLIDHRQNHNPLKTVYRVLKFAKQHKYPVNRSAFTYGEDEIPSRIDLGKSKYGGPFTTEEVEDVKTFFRIIAVLAVIFVFVVEVLLLLTPILIPSSENNLRTSTSIMNSLSGFFTVAVFLIYEYIVHPCFKIRCCRLSMLTRIGLCMFIGILISILIFILAAVREVGLVDSDVIVSKEQRAIEILSHWLSYVIIFFFFSSVLQFLISQAPEHMKGIFLVCTCFTIPIFAVFLDGQFKPHFCSKHNYCGVYLAGAAVAFGLLVFVVYCCVARWYKRRERDEPCNERARIEEIYGRYVQHNSIEERGTD